IRPRRRPPARGDAMAVRPRCRAARRLGWLTGKRGRGIYRLRADLPLWRCTDVLLPSRNSRGALERHDAIDLGAGHRSWALERHLRRFPRVSAIAAALP